jgi:predicted dinucleotide-utilizing enzyme
MSSIGIGLVGAGWMGATLLRRFSEHEGVQVIGIHQRRRDKALEVMNELGIREGIYFDDFEEMLGMPDLDAVIICSTNEGAWTARPLRQWKRGSMSSVRSPVRLATMNFCVRLSWRRQIRD